MQKNKVMLCWNCGEKTVHNFVSKQSPAEGTGPIRALAAVFTLGLTETAVLADVYYKCTKCGELKKYNP